MSARFSARAVLVPVALTFAALMTADAARADLKVVQKVTTSGTGMAMNQGKSANAITTTSYYKGNKSRHEQGGNVTLYDGATKKLLVLNTARKTYSVMGSQQANPQVAAMRFETTATFAPGGQTRTIGGKLAKNYLVKGTLSAKPPEGASGKPNRQRLTMQLDSEFWTTEAVKGVAVQQAAPEMGIFDALGSGMKPLIDKFAQIKGVTLAYTQKMSFGMSGTASVGASTMGTSSVKTELVSLSEAPLPDSLFTIPKGYMLSKETPRPRPTSPIRPGARSTP